MARPRRMLVLECIPQNQGKDEGLVLYHFLRMRMPRSVDYFVLKGKKDLIRLLERKGQDYSMVHFSSHGRKEGYFSLAKGFLTPAEFPEGCFRGAEVTFSSCEVGRSGFMDELHARTGMRMAVAPMNDVVFIDAAMFYIHYYYFRCHKRYSALNSFNRTDGRLRDKMKGGFRFFEWR
ncbi:MAG: hypothetical protein MUE65_00545 [Methanomassiliicoccales archaeon]|nr:hypothetical protein [Methanomassiliicoccales archaeon]